MIKLAIIFSPDKMSGKLTKYFTGCYAYHTAWVDTENNKMYDMHLIRRRRNWPHYNENNVLLFDIPGITKEFLEKKLEEDESTYGFMDYIMFGLRPIYHLFGKSTVNAGGVICSEMINNDVWEIGGTTPWPLDTPPPSPCDWYNWLMKGE
jgi:hypothetical protein